LRSKYPKKVAVIGSTVSGQGVYDWPEDLLLPLSLSVGGADPWEATSAEAVKQYGTGSLILHRQGAWWDAPGEDGVRRLNLYPMPGDEDDIELEWVFVPPPMSGATDEPAWLPKPFHKGLVYEVAADYYETVEDNPELGQRNAEKMDALVAELTRYDNMRRSGNGVFQVPVVGWTA
jgi:hypothetical protein